MKKGTRVKILPWQETTEYDATSFEGMYGTVLDTWDRKGLDYYLVNVPEKMRHSPDSLDVVYKDQLQVVSEEEYAAAVLSLQTPQVQA